MVINVVGTVQFMMKNKERDTPRILPIQTFKTGVVVDVPEDIKRFVPEYLESYDSDSPGVYDATDEEYKKFKKVVKKEYPELFQVYKQPDRNLIVEHMMDLSIQEEINMQVNAKIDEILDINGIKPPPDTDTEYYADKFIKITQWTATLDT